MSLDKTLIKDYLNCIKLLPFYPNSSIPLKVERNKQRPICVVFLFLLTSDVQHCRLYIELFTQSLIKLELF